MCWLTMQCIADVVRRQLTCSREVDDVMGLPQQLGQAEVRQLQHSQLRGMLGQDLNKAPT